MIFACKARVPEETETIFHKRLMRTTGASLCALWLLVGSPAHPLAAAAQAEPETKAPGSFVREDDHRIAMVTYRLGLLGQSYCTAGHPLTGLALHQLGEYAPKDQPAAAEAFGIGKGPGIVAVVADSPAARAGIRAGDVLLSIDGVTFAAPAVIAAERDPKIRRKKLELVESQLEEALRRGTVQLAVLRDRQQLTLPLAAATGCEIRGRLARSKQANAFADGRYAIMTTKMLEFMQNDDELAVAMAHEAAHNLLGHPAQLEEQKVPNGILRSFGKNASRVRATEDEADRLGVKLLWAAGYDVSAAIPFWRRLYSKYDPFPLPKLLNSHPSFAARERMLREVIGELSPAETARPPAN